MPTESHSSAELPPKPDERTPLDWPRETGRLERVLEAIELRKKRVQRRRVRLVAGAASALLIASVARYGWDTRLPRTVALPDTAARNIIAGPERRALPDGSFAEINPGSVVTVEFTAARRRVVLRRGEAHFQVVPDATRPFVVAAGGIEFRAVGTAFAVQLSGTKVEMVVTQGEVAVDREGAPPGGPANDMPATLAVVAAGQHVAVDLVTHAMVAPLVTPLAPRESDQKLAWRVPRLQLNDTPLREVVAAINAHTVARLELADAELGSLEVSGILRVDNIDTLLTMLERNYGVRAERNEAGVAILRRVPR